MIINKVITHILDKNSDGPVLSDIEQSLTPEIDALYQKLIRKILRDSDIRKAKFVDYGDNKIRVCADHILYDDNAFVLASHSIANLMFDAIKVNAELNSHDLTVVKFSHKDQRGVAIIMLDYRKLYNHYVSVEDEKVKIKLLPNETGIQSTAKIYNAAIVSPSGINDEWQLQVLDKTGEKRNGDSAFVSDFLRSEKIADDLWSTKMFRSCTENFIVNTYGREPVEAEKTREILNYNLKEGEKICIDLISEDLFPEDDYRQQLYKEMLSEKGISDFFIDKDFVKRKMKRRNIRTNTGFKVVGPLEDFNDPMRFKLTKNPNGTVNIEIRNIEFIEEH